MRNWLLQIGYNPSGTIYYFPIRRGKENENFNVKRITGKRLPYKQGVTQTGWNEMKPQFPIASPLSSLLQGCQIAGEPLWDKFPKRSDLDIDITTNILKNTSCMPLLCWLSSLMNHCSPDIPIAFKHCYNLLGPLCNTTIDRINVRLGNLSTNFLLLVSWAGFISSSSRGPHCRFLYLN